jgi:hypothetical protein
MDIGNDRDVVNRTVAEALLPFPLGRAVKDTGHDLKCKTWATAGSFAMRLAGIMRVP